MISRRLLVLGVMFLLPVLVYVGLGAYALWQTGLFRWTWWIIPGCWLVTYGLSVAWKPQRYRPEELEPSAHWTPQDTAALLVVQQFQQEVEEITPEQLTDLRFYVQQSQELARRIARHYHPQAREHYSSLTVVEVLAAIRLAVEDVEEWFRDSVPGGHLVTIEQWRLLGKAPKWVKRISNAGWLASVVVNPVNLAKFVTSKLTLGPLAEGLKTELLAAVYLRFLRQSGFYLIEMNSGRLRRGASHYRAVFGSPGRTASSESASAPGAATAPQRESIVEQVRPESVVIAVIGQVKAGKSSLINLLLGERQTVTDVLPATRTVTRHLWRIPGTEEAVTLLDTPGYADAGATPAEIAEMSRAVSEADLILLVCDAHAPGKSADLKVLQELRVNQARHVELKPAPVLVCLTHIDLLSPVLEWSPPYDWTEPQHPKERSIHAAREEMLRLFGSMIVDAVPVCTDSERGRTYNVTPGLLAALIEHVSVGKSVALLKAYEKSLNAGRWSELLKQVRTSGESLVKVWIEERLLPHPQQEQTAKPTDP